MVLSFIFGVLKDKKVFISLNKQKAINMKVTADKIIGELVAEDYRAAGVFKSFGIDFCCKGNRTIGEASQAKKVDIEALLKDINETVSREDNPAEDYDSWPLDRLADHIENKHHRYVEKQIPILQQFLDKLCKVHGQRHPELFGIADHFKQSSGELAKHMKKEELILFPFIRKMQLAREQNESLNRPHFGTVINPVEMMEHEHEAEGERFRKIAVLSNNYTPPADACNTYRVAFAMLEEFEQDLHLHIHLENNILFPKAIQMEKELCV